jgi:hypothetical protein
VSNRNVESGHLSETDDYNQNFHKIVYADILQDRYLISETTDIENRQAPLVHMTDVAL